MEKEQDRSGWMRSIAQAQKLPFLNARPGRGDSMIVSTWRMPVWSAQVTISDPNTACAELWDGKIPLYISLKQVHPEPL